MFQSSTSQVIPDNALIDCLRIFATRGRKIRELAQAQPAETTKNPVSGQLDRAGEKRAERMVSSREQF